MGSFGTLLEHRVVFPLLALAAMTGTLQAQQTGEIRLQVKDPSGAVVVASGTLRKQGHGVNQSFQTDAQGLYNFASLPYGRYRVELSKDGFATQSSLIDVQSGTPI